MAESEEERKSLLIKVKEESGKSWLKMQLSKNEYHGNKKTFLSDQCRRKTEEKQ